MAPTELILIKSEMSWASRILFIIGDNIIPKQSVSTIHETRSDGVQSPEREIMSSKLKTKNIGAGNGYNGCEKTGQKSRLGFEESSDLLSFLRSYRSHQNK